jgi:hypothetical protein
MRASPQFARSAIKAALEANNLPFSKLRASGSEMWGSVVVIEGYSKSKSAELQILKGIAAQYGFIVQINFGKLVP